MLTISRDDISCTEIQQFAPDQRFIKLPIENYLKVLGITPRRPQYAVINALNNPKYRFVTACLARRLGKTYIANIIAQCVCLIPNSRVCIVAPNYTLSGISFDIQEKLIDRFNMGTVRRNRKDRMIELENGSMITIGSVGQADSLVGVSNTMLIFDEAAIDVDGGQVFNVQLLPTLDKTDAKALFISTPRGSNYFLEFMKRGYSDEYKRWATIVADVEENPAVLEEDLDDARRSMSSAQFRQEYYCEVSAVEGLIYSLDSQYIVERDFSPVETIIGMDVGYRDPSAIAVIQCDGSNFYIIDEWFEAGKATPIIATALLDLRDRYNADYIYIDSAAAQLRADLAYQYDIFTLMSKKDRLLGIGYITALIEQGRLFVHPRCVQTLEMFNNYAWKEKSLEREVPEHKYSHMADAIRYALYSHSVNVTELM